MHCANGEKKPLRILIYCIDSIGAKFESRFNAQVNTLKMMMQLIDLFRDLMRSRVALMRYKDDIDSSKGQN